MTELLIGCGNRREKVLNTPNGEAFTDLTTLDIDPACRADLTWDLNVIPMPFTDNAFDEIHASEVLEHTGQQGDWRFFFAQFAEFWRILKPGGFLCASCPSLSSPWLWGDPGHTRVIAPQSLIFLQQPQYEQVGRTAMTDYRDVWRADYDVVFQHDDGQSFRFCLQAVKPSRIADGR